MKVFLTKGKIVIGIAIILGCILFEMLYCFAYRERIKVKERSFLVEVYISDINVIKLRHERRIDVRADFINPVTGEFEQGQNYYEGYLQCSQIGETVTAYYDPITKLLHSGYTKNPYDLPLVPVFIAGLGMILVVIGYVQVMPKIKLIKKNNVSFVTVKSVFYMTQQHTAGKLICKELEREYISNEVSVRQVNIEKLIGSKVAVYIDPLEQDKYYVEVPGVNKVKELWVICLIIIFFMGGFALNHLLPIVIG